MPEPKRDLDERVNIDADPEDVLRVLLAGDQPEDDDENDD